MESNRLQPRTLDLPPITDDTMTRAAFLTDARSPRQFIKVAANPSSEGTVGYESGPAQNFGTRWESPMDRPQSDNP